MTARKSRPRAISLEHAFELCEDTASARRRPAKVMAELMGVSRATYGRWTTECEMPANRIRQFETLCGATYVSEWLAMAGGERIVVDIPSGRAATAVDVNRLQALLTDAVGLIIRHAEGDTDPATAVAAILAGQAGLAWHKANIEKHAQPELAFMEDSSHG